MDRFIQRKEFAELCGVKPPSITKATKPGKALHDALTGDKIDCAHDQARAYYTEKTGKELPTFDPSTNPAPNSTGGIATTLDPSAYMNMTVGEIVQKYGTMKEFKDVLSAYKIQSDIQYRELQNAERRGDVVPREMVKHHIFGYIERTNLRLLRDFPKTSTKKIASMIKAGQTIEEAEAEIRIMMSNILSELSETTTRLLKKPA